MSKLTITYTCCKAVYSMPTGVVGDAGPTIAALDKLHADKHPECPPLDALDRPETGE